MNPAVVSTPLNEYLKEASLQIARARHAARALEPCPHEIVEQLTVVIKAITKIMADESAHYKMHNTRSEKKAGAR